MKEVYGINPTPGERNESDLMRQHMRVIVNQDNHLIGKTPIADPFHTTQVHVDVKFGWWDWLKMIAHRTYRTVITVRVQADDMAYRKWFGHKLRSEKPADQNGTAQEHKPTAIASASAAVDSCGTGIILDEGALARRSKESETRPEENTEAQTTSVMQEFRETEAERCAALADDWSTRYADAPLVETVLRSLAQNIRETSKPREQVAAQDDAKRKVGS